jgi:hypothetical protein
MESPIYVRLPGPESAPPCEIWEGADAPLAYQVMVGADLSKSLISDEARDSSLFEPLISDHHREQLQRDGRRAELAAIEAAEERMRKLAAHTET